MQKRFETRDGNMLVFGDEHLSIGEKRYDYWKVGTMGYRQDEGVFTFEYDGESVGIPFIEDDKMEIAKNMKVINDTDWPEPDFETSLETLIPAAVSELPAADMDIPEPEPIENGALGEMISQEEEEKIKEFHEEAERIAYPHMGEEDEAAPLDDFYAEFIGKKKADVYIRKFEGIEEKKVSWNWCAFLAGPFWLLYRRMVMLAIVFILVSGIFISIANTVVTGLVGQSSIFPFIVMFIPNILLGLFGNLLYKRRIDGLIDGNREYAILKYGGTRKLNVIIGIAICLFATVAIAVLFVVVLGLAFVPLAL